MIASNDASPFFSFLSRLEFSKKSFPKLATGPERLIRTRLIQSST